MAQQKSEAAFPPQTRVRRKGYLPSGSYTGTVLRGGRTAAADRVFVSWDYGVNSAVGRPPFLAASDLERL